MPAPLGYLNQGKGQPKILDPKKGPLIKMAFELYATGEYNLDRLQKKLSEFGLTNRYGNPITDNGLSMILNNPFYMGLIHIKKTGEFYEGSHEPLVSKLLFEQVKKVLSGKVNARKRKHEFLFRKLVRCSLCGYKLIGETHKGHVYYRCQTKNCSNTGVREEVVSKAVEQKVKALVLSPEEKEQAMLELKAFKKNWVETQTEQISKLTIRSEAVTERLSRLTDAFLDGNIEKTLFDEKKKTLLLERREIEDRLSEMRNGNPSVPEQLEKFLELTERAYSLYKTDDLEKKRRLLRILTSNLEMHSKTIDFTLASPFAEVADRQKIVLGSPSSMTSRMLKAVCGALLNSVGASRFEQIKSLIPSCS
jgi:hypothetical protein